MLYGTTERNAQFAKKRAQPDLLRPPFELLKNENYQRLRPLLLLSRPPPPRLSRLAIGLASLTVSVRPSSCVPFKATIAFCASLPEPISTKPKPRDWPVNLSEITLADSTVPCVWNISCSCPSVTEKGKPPTYTLLFMFSSYKRMLVSLALRNLTANGSRTWRTRKSETTPWSDCPLDIFSSGETDWAFKIYLFPIQKAVY